MVCLDFFFEGYLILFLDTIKKGNNNKSEEYLKKLASLKEKGPFEKIITQSLQDFFYFFKNKKKTQSKKILAI